MLDAGCAMHRPQGHGGQLRQPCARQNHVLDHPCQVRLVTGMSLLDMTDDGRHSSNRFLVVFGLPKPELCQSFVSDIVLASVCVPVDICQRVCVHMVARLRCRWASTSSRLPAFKRCLTLTPTSRPVGLQTSEPRLSIHASLCCRPSGDVLGPHPSAAT